ncbi:MFS transporter [Sphingorhabdus sp. M41]|uniref:MFS transporter n=1 Tax=Sphingorhabdus sp. M41 TaxID=1806885 RepID=UPI00078C9BB6|nr:MFS transporter [Sphingorhabdus sp. M41]AMO72855.1 hypothetical protein AZE99_14240 [Sphingorhabdus sp. M41]
MSSSDDNVRIFNVWQLTCFGLLTTPLAMAGLAMAMYLPTFYAVDMGLGLGLVGAIFVLGRLLDIVTDPLIGHWSDETRSRFGPRKPWMIAGVLGFSVAVYLFLAPPDTIGPAYLILASGLYFLFYTILDVPYSSIGLEISPDVHERSLLAGSKAIFQVVGAIVAAALPFIMGYSIGEALHVIAYAIIALCFIGLMLFLLFVPTPARTIDSPRLTPVEALKSVLSDRRYRYLLVSFLIVQTANSLVAGLMVLYVVHIVGAAELVGLFLAVLLLSSAAFLPLWIYLSKRYSKKTSWMAAILLCAFALALIPLVGRGDVTGAIILSIIIGSTFGSDAIMPTSMLADIVYEKEQEGNNRLGGLYLAVKNSVSKLSFIVPMGLAFPALGYIGFETTGADGPNAMLTFLFFYSALPILLRLIAFYVLKTGPDFIVVQKRDSAIG